MSAAGSDSGSGDLRPELLAHDQHPLSHRPTGAPDAAPEQRVAKCVPGFLATFVISTCFRFLTMRGLAVITTVTEMLMPVCQWLSSA